MIDRDLHRSIQDENSRFFWRPQIWASQAPRAEVQRAGRLSSVWGKGIGAKSSLLTVPFVVIRCAVSFDEPSLGLALATAKC
jgi:hypothetical protein